MRKNNPGSLFIIVIILIFSFLLIPSVIEKISLMEKVLKTGNNSDSYNMLYQIVPLLLLFFIIITILLFILSLGIQDTNYSLKKKQNEIIATRLLRKILLW